MPLTRVQTISSTGRNLSSLNLLLASAVSSGDSIIANLAINRGGGLTLTAVVDNKNDGNYSTAFVSTLASTAHNSAEYYKLNVSSGAGASTYRVSVNFAAQHTGINYYLTHYTGQALEFSTVALASGNSSNHSPGAITCGGTPVLFHAGTQTPSSAVTWRSTMAGGFVVVDSKGGTGDEASMLGEYITSSATVTPTFHTDNAKAFTAWATAYAAFTGGGGGADLVWTPGLTLMGMQ